MTDSKKKEKEEKFCHWFDPPPECQNVEWYNSIPFHCVNCIDRHLFDMSYRSPNEVVSDPRTGEITYKLSEWNQKVKGMQVYMDTMMEFMQLKTYKYSFWLLFIFRFFYTFFSTRGNVPNPKNFSQGLSRELMNFGNGIFPRILLAVVFSYIVEGVIKHNFFRHRPNMTQDAVADGDRYMGINDLKKNNESYEMWNRSKGPLVGIKSHRSSFPSGHNIGAWTLFAVILFTKYNTDLDNRSQPVGSLLKLAMAFTLILCFYQVYARVSLGAWHWPTDVIAGMFLGFVSAFVGAKIYNMLKYMGASARFFTFLCWVAFMFITLVGFILGFFFGEEFLYYSNSTPFETPDDNKLHTLDVSSLGTMEINEYTDIVKHNGDWSRIKIPISTPVRNLDPMLNKLRLNHIYINCDTGFGPADDRYWTPASGGYVDSNFTYHETTKYGVMTPGMYNTNQKSFYSNAMTQCLPENIHDSELKNSSVIDDIKSMFGYGKGGGDTGMKEAAFNVLKPYLIYFGTFMIFTMIWQFVFDIQQRKRQRGY